MKVLNNYILKIIRKNKYLKKKQFISWISQIISHQKMNAIYLNILAISAFSYNIVRNTSNTLSKLSKQLIQLNKLKLKQFLS
jgi:hypothetical protein